MKTITLSALLACLVFAGCALAPFSTRPEVDIDPDKVDEPAPERT